MQTDKDPSIQEPDKEQGKSTNTTLEVCFTIVIGILVAAAFLRSLTYDFVSARTPLVILVPLLILTGIQLKRSWGNSNLSEIKNALSMVFKLKNREFNGIAGFFLWMIFLLILIFVTGHYVGIAVFMFFLMNMVSEEKFSLSLIITIGVTVVIYLLFEHLFNIELYRGLIFRIWMGYGI
jgi:hypothetical protein